MGVFIPLFLLGIGIFFAGDAIAIPAFYIAAVGTESFREIIVLAIGTTIAADTLWYSLGRYLKKEKLYAFPLLKSEKTRSAIDALFERRGLTTVFLSRFVYGARLATQALAGTHRVPFGKYFLINSAGVVLWFSGIALVISLITFTLGDLQETVRGFEIAAALLLVILVGINVLGKKLLCLKNGSAAEK